ncbi:MAG TPA: esterase-like activity of phytase family protein [Steroidobacteraceae bacterium]|nr:esterase-like activity of phytase family protein [Steroidobacteraceae bacterium]
MIRKVVNRSLMAAALAAVPALNAYAAPDLVAAAGIPAVYEDLSNQTAAPLENGVPGNRLGGFGSSIAYAGGDTFLLLPDRGPNAVEFASSIDSTVSYINRFHAFNLRLLPATPSDAGVQDSNTTPNAVPGLTPPFDVAGLPFILTPTLRSTTLLWSQTPLNYGKSGAFTDDNGNPIGGGAPALNKVNHRYYFTGRSDGFAFNPAKPAVYPNLSNNPDNARLDPESIKISNDGLFVFISDEYGPYVYEFLRATGQRIRSFRLPDSFAVIPNTTTGTETGSFGTDTQNSNNTRLLGRVANKGAEGLAITPDGKTLAVALQSALIQDGGTGPNGAFTRIVTIDIASGKVKAQYAYPLFATKPGKYATISELLALNDHQFLVDERDGKGFEGGGAASYKKLNLVDIQAPGVADVSNNPSFLTNSPASVALQKVPFLDVVAVVKAHGLDPSVDLPAKLEGITFGQDVSLNGATKHTLYLSSDNDFLASFVLDDDQQTHVFDNPSRIFVFAFDQSDLDSLGATGTAQNQGWKYVPQPLVSEQVPDFFSPEQFPSFLFGLPAFDSRGSGTF